MRLSIRLRIYCQAQRADLLETTDGQLLAQLKALAFYPSSFTENTPKY